MTPEQRDRLEEMKADVQAAARAMQGGDTADAVESLIDAMLSLSTYLESLE